QMPSTSVRSVLFGGVTLSSSCGRQQDIHPNSRVFTTPPSLHASAQRKLPPLFIRNRPSCKRYAACHRCRLPSSRAARRSSPAPLMPGNKRRGRTRQLQTFNLEYGQTQRSFSGFRESIRFAFSCASLGHVATWGVGEVYRKFHTFINRGMQLSGLEYVSWNLLLLHSCLSLANYKMLGIPAHFCNSRRTSPIGR